METQRPLHEQSWFSFGIEEEMPVVKIPLLKNDKAYLELGEAYNTTLSRNFAWLINYFEKPLDWETYLSGDQDWIAARIRTVYEGMKDGRIKEGNAQERPLDIIGKVEGSRHDLDRLLATIEQDLGRDWDRSLGSDL